MGKRLHVIDALRGFAIISIMLLHNIEHFDMYYTAENIPEWMVPIDQVIWHILFFMFSGKSFAIFALLFGLTFYIQFENQRIKGNDFRLRFAWRMLLLLLFGVINSAFFQGDILTIYAVVGLFMIPLANLKNSVLLVIASLLLLQPLQLIQIYHAIQHPNIILPNPTSWTYFGNMGTYIQSDSLLDTLYGNLTNGRKAVLLWNYENGRYFQILALFILGYILGRKKLFEWNETTKKFWRKTAFASLVLYVLFYVLNTNLETLTSSKAISATVLVITSSFMNLSFMLLLVAGFILLFYTSWAHKALQAIAPVGKMSLSNYVFQSIVGSVIYYGFGIGLYKYTGATYSFIIGLLLAAIFIVLCTWWNKYHKHGPLEGIWHKLTWIKFKS
ncbi:membrane protein [Neptunitalea chrysea]|uniref:Membrane protein n=1 Tax=Neptunitalea chrysea TaxID=1647581 RepID=A0A9W6B4N7_9FLAO|nr:DUF418 domain-containing protein [Neptunitalea chrysea]GLB52481.1 membrane protein [Neptunitalea chrysea]